MIFYINVKSFVLTLPVVPHLKNSTNPRSKVIVLIRSQFLISWQIVVFPNRRIIKLLTFRPFPLASKKLRDKFNAQSL